MPTCCSSLYVQMSRINASWILGFFCIFQENQVLLLHWIHWVVLGHGRQLVWLETHRGLCHLFVYWKLHMLVLHLLVQLELLLHLLLLHVVPHSIVRMHRVGALCIEVLELVWRLFLWMYYLMIGLHPTVHNFKCARLWTSSLHGHQLPITLVRHCWLK